MCAPSPPAPPDPKVTAGAQTATNIGTAIANTNLQQVNQDTPWGSQTYTRRQSPNYDPNYQPPEIVEVPGDPSTQQVEVLRKGNEGSGGLFGVGDQTFYSYAAAQNAANAGAGATYRVGDQTFDSRAQAEEYVSGLAPEQYETYTYVDPNTGTVHEIPLYDVETTLPEDQQKALDAQFATNKVLSRIALDQSRFLRDYLGQGINTDDLAGPVGSDQVGDLNLRERIGNAGDIQDSFRDGGELTRSYGTNFSKDRRRVERALMERLNRQFRKDENALQQRLANQGIGVGSDAYQAEYDQFGREKTDARLGAILAGGQEQSRLADLARDRAMFENQATGQRFGQNLAQANFTNQAQAQQFWQNARNTALTNQARESEYNSRMANANLDNSLRNQQLNERFALRNQPINEIAALLSGSQVQDPGFSVQTPAGIPTTDYAGIVSDNYNQQLRAWQMENANSQNLMGGLMGLGANLIMASDRRLKRDVQRVGEIDGLNVYEYEYVWGGGRRCGYMADEVRKVHPEAVLEVDGFLALDYARLPEVPA